MAALSRCEARAAEQQRRGGPAAVEVGPHANQRSRGLRSVPSDSDSSAVSDSLASWRGTSVAGRGLQENQVLHERNVGSGELDLPDSRCTRACWLTIPWRTWARLPCAPEDGGDGVVGLACAIRQVAQLLLMCDRHDVGISIDKGERAEPTGRRGWRRPELAGDKSPRRFIYDNYPGGIGFSEPLFCMHRDLLAGTRHLIAQCECESGCPSCVGPVGDTGPLAKTAALRILDLLLANLSTSQGTEA